MASPTASVCETTIKPGLRVWLTNSPKYCGIVLWS
jgi:hypothetical protein